MNLFVRDDLDILEPPLRQAVAELLTPLNVCWEADRQAVPENEVDALVTAHHHLDADEVETWALRFRNLKVVSLAFTGYDGVDLEACGKAGWYVYYVPGYSTASVAELTVGLTLAVLRRIPLGDNDVRSGGWHYRAAPGGELEGKTVGIVGSNSTTPLSSPYFIPSEIAFFTSSFSFFNFFIC